MTDVITKVAIGGVEYPFAGGGSEGQEVVYLTQAEYDALPASKLTDGKIYKVKTTGVVPGGSADASDVGYDNTTSGLTADNVQDAIDEVNVKIGGKLNEGFTLYVNNTGQTDSQTLTATADEYVVIEKYSGYNLNVDIGGINVFTFNGSYVVDKKITCFVKKGSIFTVSTTAGNNNVGQATVSFI